jgi:hypothetical protein
MSQIFTASKYGNLKSKMNLIRGLDLPAADGKGGHYTGIPLGCGTGESYDTTTIDQIIGSSSQFYASNPFRRVVNAMPVTDYESKYNMSSIAATMGPKRMFSDLFSGTLPTVGSTPPPVMAADINLNRRLAMTSALGELSNLSKSTKLAASDKVLLSNHADMVNNLIKTLAPPVNNGGGGSAVTGCVKPTLAAGLNENMNSTSATNNTARLRACLDQIYMAFNCQLTNIATLHPVVAAFEDGILCMGDAPNDNYHQMAGHKLPSEYTAARYLRAKTWIFDQVLYLVNLMESTRESNGLTMLDNSLVVVITNDGMSVHSTLDMPVITFGSLGGAIKTGNYINYQRTGLPVMNVGGWDTGPGHTITRGHLLNSFHTTILNALKIPHTGFGNYGAATNYAEFVTAAGKQANLPILV